MVRRVLALLLWRTVALICVALGFVGVFVPGLPTVPFLLVAAWAGGRGWPQLEAWLLNHPKYGATILRWRHHRAVPRRAKWAASAMMLLSAGAISISPVALGLKIGIPLLMIAVAVWLWRRPEL